MQSFTGISSNTQSKPYMLSLTECVWECQKMHCGILINMPQCSIKQRSLCSNCFIKTLLAIIGFDNTNISLGFRFFGVSTKRYKYLGNITIFRKHLQNFPAGFQCNREIQGFQLTFTTTHSFVVFYWLNQIKRYMHRFMVISFGLFMRKTYTTYNKLYRQSNNCWHNSITPQSFSYLFLEILWLRRVES